MLRRQGLDLYADCCARWQAKPNEAIRRQIDRCDLMNLTVVDATNTFLGSPNAHAVIDFAAQHRCLEELLLPQNGLDMDCIRHLCEVLQAGAHPRLRHVDVSCNDLTVPSVRLLWQAACAVPTLTKVSVAGCGVSSEWVERLERTTAANADLQRFGYLTYGPPRQPPGSWHTAFILLLGATQHVTRYTTHVLPVLASYTAKMRVRVAPLVIRPEDSREQVERKLDCCRVSQGGEGRTWCVVLVDAACPLSIREQHALRHVLSEGPLPPPEPLFDKQGRQRAATHRLTQTLFVYYANPSNRVEEVGDGVEALPPAKWLRMTGLGTASVDTPGKEATDPQPFDELVLQPACVLTDASYEVRCMSDLLVALQTVFREPLDIDIDIDGGGGGAGGGEDGDLEGGPPVLAIEEDARATSTGAPAAAATDAARGGGGDLPFEELRPRVYAAVRSYILGSEDSTSSLRVNVPLLVYGCRSTGKSALLSQVGRACAREQPQRRVVELSVGVGTTSLVVLLLRVLAVFTGEDGAARRAPFRSFRDVIAAVRAAIEGYAGPPLTLLLLCIDNVDTCGQPLAAAIAWLPASLPSTVGCVLTLSTESPLLPALRRHVPQPLELLVAQFEEGARLAVLRFYLQQRGVSLPGLTDPHASPAAAAAALYAEAHNPAGPSYTEAEEAYLAKDGATNVLFARLVAARARAVLASVSVRRQKKGPPLDVPAFVQDRLPNTVEEAVVAAATTAEVIGDAQTVRCVLACLCVSPLPVPDLQFICEELGGCEAQTAVPTLLQLVDSGLVSWHADSTVCVAECTARATLMERYCGAELVNRCSTMVESHLYRLVVTRSPEAVNVYRYLTPIMIDSGNFALASALLLSNTPVLDTLLHGDASLSRLYLLDALFRLVAARELLLQLTSVTVDGVTEDGEEAEDGEEDEGGEAPTLGTLDYDALLRAIVDIQSLYDGSEKGVTGDALPLRDDLFQCAAWQDGNAPYVQDARRRLTRPPHPIVHLLNAGSEDQATSLLNCGGHPCSALHCSASIGASGGPHLAVTSAAADTVYVFALEPNAAEGEEEDDDEDGQRRVREPVATLSQPFEGTDEELVGAFAAADRRVVVVSATSILLWDLASSSVTRLPNTMVHPSPSCMNLFGTQVIARQPHVSHVDATNNADGSGGSRSLYCLIDLTRKHVVRRLPQHSTTALHTALFCGNNAVVVEGAVLYRYHNETEPCGEATALFVGGRPPLEMAHDDLVECVASNEDGRLIATSTGPVLWVWMANTGELLHRIETGRSTITSLRFNRSGSQLLCRHPEGCFLWRTATGTCVAPVLNPLARTSDEGGAESSSATAQRFIPHMESIAFFDDETRLYGCLASYAVVWDAVTLTATGAVTPPQGLVAALCEHKGRLYMASTTHGDVQVFAGPLPSVEQARAGVPCTTNLFRNAKASTEAICEVRVDPSASVLACLDIRHHLRLFSLRSGRPIPWRGPGAAVTGGGDGDGEETVEVQSAILVDADTLVYLPVEHDPTLPAAAVYIVRLSTGAVMPPCLLPRELVFEAGLEGLTRVVLRAAEEVEDGLEEQGGPFAAVEYTYRGHSRLIVFTVERGEDRCSSGGHLHCQLVGHSGSLLCSALLGSFAFTVGAEDRCVRLWSLLEQHKGTERAGYCHPHLIHCVTVDPSASGVLLMLDAAGDVYRVRVGNTFSPTRATFLVERVELPTLRRWVSGFGPVAGAVVPAASSPPLLCLRGASGAVALTSAMQDQRVIQVRAGSPCEALVACLLKGQPGIVMGLADGRVALCKVQQPAVTSKGLS